MSTLLSLRRRLSYLLLRHRQLRHLFTRDGVMCSSLHSCRSFAFTRYEALVVNGHEMTRCKSLFVN